MSELNKAIAADLVGPVARMFLPEVLAAIDRYAIEHPDEPMPWEDKWPGTIMFPVLFVRKMPDAASRAIPQAEVAQAEHAEFRLWQIIAAKFAFLLASADLPGGTDAEIEHRAAGILDSAVTFELKPLQPEQ